jgi:hypothetical protein
LAGRDPHWQPPPPPHVVDAGIRGVYAGNPLLQGRSPAWPADRHGGLPPAAGDASRACRQQPPRGARAWVLLHHRLDRRPCLDPHLRAPTPGVHRRTAGDPLAPRRSGSPAWPPGAAWTGPPPLLPGSDASGLRRRLPPPFVAPSRRRGGVAPGIPAQMAVWCARWGCRPRSFWDAAP